MPQPTPITRRGLLAASAKRTISMLVALMPILLGTVLLTGLLMEFLPADVIARWFGQGTFLDALTGAFVGSLAAGHPLNSYVLAGELLARGVSLVAITAFLVSWVTVGSVQLPAEMVMLGKRFALYRNLICFGLAYTLALCGYLILFSFPAGLMLERLVGNPTPASLARQPEMGGQDDDL